LCRYFCYFNRYKSNNTWTAQTGNPAGATLGTTTGGIASVSFAANASGIYNFIYTANGCTDTMNVTVNPKPNAGANQTGICAGTSTTLTGTTPTTGTWSAQTGNPAGATLGTTTGGIASVSFAQMLVEFIILFIPRMVVLTL
jgi:hypothetical protein